MQVNNKSIATFQKQLLDWYRNSARRLPWRQEPSLYRTVVSEFMCQQTQVETVLPYFDRWMRKFPDFETLSRSRESSALKLWEGLGYYSRARNLHRLAGHISGEGIPPADLKEWLKLPGIGPYTAAAILSISFNAPLAVVDGNVIRVISRLFALQQTFKDSATAGKVISPLADQLLNQKNPGDHNQAMMELGARICGRTPNCGNCPVSSLCQAYQNGSPENIPRFAARKTKQLTIKRVWAMDNGRLLLQKGQTNSKRLADIYELPVLNESLGSRVNKKLLAIKKRGIGNERITEKIYRLNTETPTVCDANQGMEWVETHRLKDLTLSGPHKKWIQELSQKSA